MSTTSLRPNRTTLAAIGLALPISLAGLAIAAHDNIRSGDHHGGGSRFALSIAH